jgi:diacylglycerol O-acyltransferase 1
MKVRKNGIRGPFFSSFPPLFCYLYYSVITQIPRPLEELDWVRMVERILKLSIPMLYVWLCMFYCFFHCWLNILAEVLRFGDRMFYAGE